MIHCLGCAASFLFLPSFHEIFLHPHPFLPSSGGVVPFVLHYWQTCFGEGTRAKRKSEGEEKKGRKEEGKKKKTRKRGIPISVNALVSLPLNFAVPVTVHALLPLPYCTNFEFSTVCSGVARTGRSLQPDRSRLVCGAHSCADTRMARISRRRNRP